MSNHRVKVLSGVLAVVSALLLANNYVLRKLDEQAEKRNTANLLYQSLEASMHDHSQSPESASCSDSGLLRSLRAYRMLLESQDVAFEDLSAKERESVHCVDSVLAEKERRYASAYSSVNAYLEEGRARLDQAMNSTGLESMSDILRDTASHLESLASVLSTRSELEEMRREVERIKKYKGN